jgi:imidazolonepropionase-like amidohydrolase
MRHRLVLSVLFLCSFLSSCTQQKPVGAGATIVFTHVTIINTAGGPDLTDRAVFITGDRITDITPTGSVRPPKGIRVVDAKGKYLIPGLWDMHVHWYDERFLPLFIANGVTGVRQMYGFPFHLEWREKASRGELLAPRQVVASPIVDGPGATWVGSIEIGNEQQARDAVRKIKESGFDFVKIYNGIPRDAFYALADEAAKQGLPFAGHVPHAVSALDASDAGQKSIEHLNGVLEACSPDGHEITQGYLKYTAGVNNSKGTDMIRRRALRVLFEKVLTTYDEKRANALFARFAQNGTWQCPTLVVNRVLAFIDQPDFRNDPRLKYFPAPFRARWQPENNPLWASRSAEDYAVSKRRFQKEMAIVSEMRRAGVLFLAGTDTGNPYCFPGFSLHDELSLLVEAGFTPLEALQTATLNPAIYLGAAESYGTVEKGKVADLLLLEADPLEKIENTKRIAAVVLGGKLFGKQQIDEILTNFEKIANQKPILKLLMKTIQEQDVKAAIKQYYDLKTQDPETYDFSESELCSLGYDLWKAERIKDAIEIFKLNVIAYPHSSDAYYCLGDAYMEDGDKENAIISFKKSLELDPQNNYAAEMLKKLGKGPHS